jgi:hypothetical protein
METQESNHPNRILGVDFSGAVNCGDTIWISTATIERQVLKIRDCYPAKELPGSSVERDICLPALRDFISNQRACICGLDFPFGLPYSLVIESSWEEFVLYFGDRYQSPEDFKEACFADANGLELRRVTDEESKTPFSPYNLRLFRQTYFGIHYLLAPLAKEKSACILPMEQSLPKKPSIIEVCPASTLKKFGLYYGYHYKGPKEENRASRAKILDRLEAKGSLVIPTKALKSRVVDNKGGDALDCIIASIAAFRSCHDLTGSCLMRMPYTLEGYVYV